MLDIELYGGKRGLLEHSRARLLYALGAYGNVRDVEWSLVRRLVFVCRGNICRSPYASSRAQSLGLPAVSFGLDAAEGAPANPAAAKYALTRGIDLSAHRSARMEPARLADGDWVIVFEPAQLAEVRRSIGHGLPATLLGVWSRPSRPHIQDPYGRSERYFQRCFSVIDENIAELFGRMVRGGAPATKNASARVARVPASHRNSCDGTAG